MVKRLNEALAYIGDEGLCPVCGESITVVDVCKAGRLIGSCGDAFWIRQWVAEPDDDE